MSNEGKKDSANDTMMLIIIGVIAFMAFNYFFGEHIKSLFLTYKLIQLKLISYIVPSDYFTEAITYLETNRSKDVTLPTVMAVAKRVGYIYNLPFLIVLGYWGYKIYKANPSQKFKRVLSMQSLKESEQKLWPYIAPMVNVDLMKESFEKGPYALATKPYDFATKYHLLTDEKNVASLDTNKAEKIFISQLGKPFSGFDRMKKHEKALAAIFAANGCGDKDGAMKAINDIAISAAAVGIKKMPELSSAEPLFKYLEDPRVLKVVESHAYIYTMLSGMMEFARGTGVFPPSYFIWLKPRDRTLWYTLNCVGRQVAFVEVAGIFGHWKAEQSAGHKIDAPYVTNAVDGLVKALGEVKIV